jgi:hypothetical protein
MVLLAEALPEAGANQFAWKLFQGQPSHVVRMAVNMVASVIVDPGGNKASHCVKTPHTRKYIGIHDREYASCGVAMCHHLAACACPRLVQCTLGR